MLGTFSNYWIQSVEQPSELCAVGIIAVLPMGNLPQVTLLGDPT